MKPSNKKRILFTLDIELDDALRLYKEQSGVAASTLVNKLARSYLLQNLEVNDETIETINKMTARKVKVKTTDETM
jgi:hypothetical protein